jgi:hypothetical protein
MDENRKGIRKSISTRWENALSKTEIYLAEKVCGDLALSLGYRAVKAKPNLWLLVCLLAFWPLQLAVAILLNLNRIGRPIRYISKRVLLETETQRS